MMKSAYWLRVPTGEIYRYILPDPEEKLPRGTEYVRPTVRESK